MEKGNQKDVREAQSAVKSGKSGKTSQPWNSSKSGEAALPAGFESVTGLGPVKDIFKVERDNVQGYMVVMGIGLAFALVGLVSAGFALYSSAQGNTEDAAGIAFGGLIPLVIGVGLMALGLRSFVSLWTGIQALATYRDGFAFRKRRSLGVWAWSEIASILSKETIHINSRGSNSTTLIYIVSKQNGEKITLSDSQLQHIRKLIDTIKRHAYPLILPTYKQAYESDQPVSFGSVTVSKPSGLTVDGKQFAWSDIANVEVKHGRLVITTKQADLLGGVHKVRVSKIPNIEILCQLIGIDPWTIDLTYI